MTSKPGKDFEKNLDLEALSAQINSYIEGYELHSEARDHLEWPALFIVGAPRSGTTLMLQFLANTGAFAYPTNLMSRFYASLTFAAQVQLMLADSRFDFGGEFSDVDTTVKFESALGKTRGTAQPSEFWYFWRRFFPLQVPTKLKAKELEAVDHVRLVSELSAMEALLGRPLLMKGVLWCFHIDFVHHILENAIFLHIRRDTISNARSLLNARKAYFGTIENWYSAKPPQYERLKTRSPFEQVVGQVLATNREIERQLRTLPDKNKFDVDYKHFCDAPLELLEKVRSRYAQADCQLSVDDAKVGRFSCRDGSNEGVWQGELMQALSRLEDDNF